MEEKQPDNVIKMRHTDPKSKWKMYGEVLFIIAWVTLGQGLCFLGATMFLNDIRVLPDDPFTLIGTMYISIGVAFLLISKFCGKRFSEYVSCKTCIELRCKNENKARNIRNHSEVQNEPNKVEEQNNENDSLITLKQTVEYAEQLKDEKDIADRKLDSHDQQWDVIEGFGDVRTNNSQDDINKTIGRESTAILTSK